MDYTEACFSPSFLVIHILRSCESRHAGVHVLYDLNTLVAGLENHNHRSQPECDPLELKTLTEAENENVVRHGVKCFVVL